jgi:hypothetical protein
VKQNIGPDVLNRLAQETKLVERQRDLVGDQFFWSIVGGFGVGQATEIAGMLRAYTKDTGHGLQYSAWYNRLRKEGFPEFMRLSYEHMQNHISHQYLPSGHLLNRFKDIYIQDGSSYRVNNLLVDTFPGRFTKTSPAAIEVHAFYSLRHATTQCFHVAPDSKSEQAFMPTAKDADLRDTLSLFDRGYSSLKRLHKIEDAGGFFMTRMKSNINPKITTVHQSKGDARQAACFENQMFQVIPLKKKANYDFSVQFRNKLSFINLRLIAIWNPNTKEHVLFLTNTDPKTVTAKMISTWYRLRWQIELLFKELKSYTQLRRFLTANPHIARGFVWASLCALFLRRFLVTQAQKTSGVRLSFHKAAISARNFMPQFICSALNHFRNLKYCLLDIFCYLASNMKFSNPKRKSTYQIVGFVL